MGDGAFFEGLAAFGAGVRAFAALALAFFAVAAGAAFFATFVVWLARACTFLPGFAVAVAFFTVFELARFSAAMAPSYSVS